MKAVTTIIICHVSNKNSSLFFSFLLLHVFLWSYVFLHASVSMLSSLPFFIWVYSLGNFPQARLIIAITILWCSNILLVCPNYMGHYGSHYSSLLLFYILSLLTVISPTNEIDGRRHHPNDLSDWLGPVWEHCLLVGDIILCDLINVILILSDGVVLRCMFYVPSSHSWTGLHWCFSPGSSGFNLKSSVPI